MFQSSGTYANRDIDEIMEESLKELLKEKQVADKLRLGSDMICKRLINERQETGSPYHLMQIL